MFKKDKLYLIAECADDSVKTQSSVYDVTLFKRFVDFEKQVERMPVVLDTLMLTTDDLQFTSTNMERLLKVLKSPFLQVKSSVIYLVDNTYDVEQVNHFLSDKGITNCIVYQGSISNKLIHDVISGEKRDTEEGHIDIVTYRMRASEYVRMRKEEERDSEPYETDEIVLQDIPLEPEYVEIVPTSETQTATMYVAGEKRWERTALAFLIAQYYAMREKTLIVERDWEFHSLSELVTKSKIPCEMIEISELFDNVSETISKIKSTQQKLIVIISKERLLYDYNFLMEFLQSNVKGYVGTIVQEQELEEIVYKSNAIIVCRNTIPDILSCCTKIKSELSIEDVSFVGVQLGSLGPANVNSTEMKNIVETVLGYNGVFASIVKLNGVLLNDKGGFYDLSSIISRTDGR